MRTKRLWKTIDFSVWAAICVVAIVICVPPLEEIWGLEKMAVVLRGFAVYLGILFVSILAIVAAIKLG